jgi:hypothetical protein
MSQSLIDLPLSELKKMLAATERTAGNDAIGARELRRIIDLKLAQKKQPETAAGGFSGRA